MDEFHLYRWVLVLWAAAALSALALSLAIPAPHGRHPRRGWGPTLPSPLAWLLMELPAVLSLGWFYFSGHRRGELVPLIFLMMWQAHYLYRGLIHPRLLGRSTHGLPASLVLMAAVFNSINGYLNGQILFRLGPEYPPGWLRLPNFLAGAALFLTGFLIHLWAERRLLESRREKEGHGLPRGGLFERVSCPEYLGELLQWIGWAVATWTLAGFALALWTFAILAPRALARHRWYRQHFTHYPSRRRALLPFLL